MQPNHVPKVDASQLFLPNLLFRWSILTILLRSKMEFQQSVTKPCEDGVIIHGGTYQRLVLQMKTISVLNFIGKFVVVAIFIVQIGVAGTSTALLLLLHKFILLLEFLLKIFIFFLAQRLIHRSFTGATCLLTYCLFNRCSCLAHFFRSNQCSYIFFILF